MIPAPILGWGMQPGELKTKILNAICVLLIGLILIVYKEWYIKQIRGGKDE